MQAIDKLKSDLDAWARRAGTDGAPDAASLERLSSDLARFLGPLPRDTLAAIMDTFRARLDVDRQAALDWLAGVASLALMDYDGTPFSAADWAEIRELLTQDAGDMDMDVLSYVMSQVMDHGGLSD